MKPGLAWQLLVVAVCSASAAGCAAQRGEAILRHPDGSVRTRHTTVNNRSEGPFAEFYLSGAPRTTGAFVDDLPHGLWEHFDDSGAIQKREVFWRGEKVWHNETGESFPTEWISRFEADSTSITNEEAATPRFANTDRVSPSDYQLVQLGIQRIVADPLPETAGGRLELFAQRRLRGPWVLLGTLAMGGIHESSNEDLSGRGIPIAEGGLAYAPAPTRLGSAHSYRGWLARLSGYGPIAPGNDTQHAVASSLAFERIGDRVLFLPRTTGVRASASAYGRSERVVWRLDAGLDTALDLSDQDDAVRVGDSVVYLARASGAVGFDLDQAVFAVEVSAAASVVEDALADRSAETAGFSVLAADLAVRPRFAFMTPMDGDLFARQFAAVLSFELAAD